MNQLKIVLLIILLILLVCINRKKEKFGATKYKKERDTRENLLHRCTDDINRLVNQITPEGLENLGISSSNLDQSNHVIGKTSKIDYATSLGMTDELNLFPNSVDYPKRSIFTDIREIEPNKLTKDNVKHSLISDFGILDVSSKYNAEPTTNP